jgi:flagellar biosynthetic protein FlhB
MSGILTLAFQVRQFPAAWRSLLRHSLDSAASQDATGLLFGAGSTLLLSTAAILGFSWAAALLGAFGQGGLIFAPAALAPSLARISPASRLRQLFSLPALGKLLKSLLPAAAIVALAVSLIERDWGMLLALPHRNLRRLAVLGLGDLFEIAWKASLVLLIWSIADYFLERQKLEGDLRMSRQDQADEYKETEGHPAIKARIRRLQKQMRRRRMLEDIKRAAVVVVNPDEYAIALEYSPENPAPTVVAKGRNLFARQIKEIARWHGIPMVENRPLAHALYRAVEVGQSIPPKLYHLVAGILAAIYRAEAQARAGAARRGGR